MQADDRGLKRAIGAVAIFAVAAVSAVWAVEITWQRDLVLATAERRLDNLTLILSAYVREDFEAVDRALKVVSALGRTIGGAAAPAAEWDRILAPTQASLPEVGSLSVVDGEGTIRHSTIPEIVGQSRRGRYLVERLASADRDVLVADTPFRAVVGSQPPMLMPLGRRLVRADGSFDGAVVATFRPEASRKFFRAVDLGRDGVLWVFHPDGFVLFREPSATNPLGDRAHGNPIFEAARRGPRAATLRRPLTAGGPRMLSAYRNLGEPPLLVAVSASERELLADWRRIASLTGVAIALLALLLGAGFGALLGQIDARATVEARLARVQKLEALGKLTGGVAHDFNNLLTVVLGYTDLLRSEVSTASEAAAEALDQIERAARSGAELTNRLLAFARRQELKVELVDLNQLVERIEPILRHLLTANVELRLRPGPLPCRVRLDAVQLETMLVNLCVNARDAMPRGGVLEIATAAAEIGRDYAQRNPGVAPGSYARLTVSDTGSGMPPEVLARVFEPFYTTKEEGRGTGLGLSMVYGFVRQSGGQITIESEPGRGTVVQAYFPCAQNVEGVEDTSTAAAAGTGAAG
jgi:two-component system, NtrC family, sensor kinase